MVRRLLIGSLILWLLFRNQTSRAKPMRAPTNIPINLNSQLVTAFQKTKYKPLLNFWLALAKMETAGFKSSLYTRYKNPWGMRIPTERKNLITGYVKTNNGYFATYSTLADAAQDIILWMDARRFPASINSLEDFVNRLGEKGYFGTEDPKQYLKKIEAWNQR